MRAMLQSGSKRAIAGMGSARIGNGARADVRLNSVAGAYAITPPLSPDRYTRLALWTSYLTIMVFGQL